MIRRLVIPVLLLAALLIRPAAIQAQVDSAFLARIPKAIDEGVKFLKARQIKDGAGKGSWGSGENPVYPGGSGAPHKDEVGITALSLLTLLSCDVLHDDPVIVDGWAFINKNIEWSVKNTIAGKMVSTYEVGVLLMAIEAMYDARHYKGKKRDPKKPPAIKLDPADDLKVKALVEYCVRCQSVDGGWRYGPSFPPPGGSNNDVSVTQIIMLGLNAAQRMGVAVNPDMVANVARWNLKAQEKDGPPANVAQVGDGRGTTVMAKDKCRGWAYIYDSKDEGEKRISGGMTASGICTLILAKAMLTPLKKITPTLSQNIDRGVFDGCAWLDANWSVDNNPGGHRSHFYYLYGLERVGVLGAMEKIGSHPWYVEGAKVLLDRQATTDGHWDSGTELQPRDVIDTCFALLFLKKATVPVGSIVTR